MSPSLTAQPSAQVQPAPYQSEYESEPSHHPDGAPALVVSEVSVERAKSLVAVLRRVDDLTAEQMLLDVADQAGVPLWAASDQVLAAVHAQVAEHGLTPQALDAALASVASVHALALPARSAPRPAA
ncbi:hypothetical protein ACFQHV_22325 [Promicromonospora thailandica]|uniref:ANTAR domain-containing protein n=1 Tax=Promicromonospora thailandica TaxID=765201 RepID=A0A9X2FXP4_9MICO|nr:hypothetical protein [Promicromonospora thailandica]MCP2263054.1 hypothetical protein [Promicromonospora thailandica]BFF18428.1 hypothetical protein GCM10025730_19490 [Promicromonospora thailandica]